MKYVGNNSNDNNRNNSNDSNNNNISKILLNVIKLYYKNLILKSKINQ